ncbi:GIN domain-containing protein [Wenyingzhuangia sp. IMCC45533]
MKRIFLALLFITQINFAQDLVRNLKPFKAISITSAMEVELILANGFKLEVTGKDVDKLSVNNKGKELKLSTSLGKKFKSDLKVKIYYSEGLRNIKLANNVIFTSKEPIIEKFLEFEAINNVKADLTVQTKYLVARLDLGSNLLLKGFADDQKVKVNTKSMYDAFNLKSKKATVEVKAGNAGIYVSEFLDANAKLKGEIVYMGDPFSVNEKTFLGKVIHKKK